MNNNKQSVHTAVAGCLVGAEYIFPELGVRDLRLEHSLESGVTVHTTQTG